MNAIAGGIIRAVLALVGGVIGSTDADLGTALKAFIDGLIAGDMNQIGATAVTLAVIVWSIYSKRKEEAKK